MALPSAAARALEAFLALETVALEVVLALQKTLNSEVIPGPGSGPGLEKGLGLRSGPDHGSGPGLANGPGQRSGLQISEASEAPEDSEPAGCKLSRFQ